MTNITRNVLISNPPAPYPILTQGYLKKGKTKQQKENNWKEKANFVNQWWHSFFNFVDDMNTKLVCAYSFLLLMVNIYKYTTLLKETTPAAAWWCGGATDLPVLICVDFLIRSAGTWHVTMTTRELHCNILNILLYSLSGVGLHYRELCVCIDTSASCDLLAVHLDNDDVKPQK